MNEQIVVDQVELSLADFEAELESNNEIVIEPLDRNYLETAAATTQIS